MGDPEALESLPLEPPPPGPCFWHAGVRTAVRCHSCNRRVCDACATTVLVEDPPEPVAACPTCATLFGVASSVPFEDPGGIGGFCRTWGRACAHPGRLFAAFPRTGAARPTVFAYLVMLPWALLASALFGLLVIMLSGFTMGHSARAGDHEVGLLLVITLSVIWGGFLLAPVVMFACALVWHLVVLCVGGQGGFFATYRILWCLLALRVTASIPAAIVSGVLEAVASGSGLVAYLAAEVWHSWALYHAARRVHGVSAGGAVAVALAPIATWCLAGILVVGLAVGLAFLL